MEETKLIYHYCGGRLEVSKVIKRAGGKAVYLQRDWDGIALAVGAICPGCKKPMERAELIDLTSPVGRAEALKAFQRARKRARRAAAAAEAPRAPAGCQRAPGRSSSRRARRGDHDTFRLYRVYEEPDDPEACAIVGPDQLQHVRPAARIEPIDVPTLSQFANYLDGELESRNSSNAGVHDALARLITELTGDNLARRVLLEIAERGTILDLR